MPEYNSTGKTWLYSEQFEICAEEMSSQEEIQIPQVAEKLGIHPFMLFECSGI